MFLSNSNNNRKKTLFIFSFFILIILISAFFYNLKFSSAAIDCCYHECNLTDPDYCVGNKVYECRSNCDADRYQDFCEKEDCSPGTCVNGVCQGGTACSPINQCSSSSGAPWYCDSSGNLVENCGICGCSGSWICGPSNTFCCDNQCNQICSPSGCTVAYDPDCGCQDNDTCCGIGCDSSNDNDCGGGSGGTVQGNINLIRTFNIAQSAGNSSVKLALADNSDDNILNKENKIDNKGKVLGVEETKNKNTNPFFQDKLAIDPDSSPENSFLTIKFTSELGYQDISQIKALLKNKENGQAIKVYDKEYFALYNDGEHNDVIRNDNNWAAIIDTAKINLLQDKYQIDLIVVLLNGENKIFSAEFEIKNPIKPVKNKDYTEDQLIVKFFAHSFNMPFDLREVEVDSENFQKLTMSNSIEKLIKDFKAIKIQRSFVLSEKEKEDFKKGIEPIKENYNIYLFTFDKSVDIDAIKQIFQQDENIIYADFNGKIHFSYVPSDRFYNESFDVSTYVDCTNFQYQDPAYSGGVNRTIAGQWGFKKIGMETAWDIFNNYSTIPRVLLVDADLTGSASGHATHMRGIITSYRSLSCSGASDPNETAGIINRNNVVDANITVLSSMYGTINSMYNYLIAQGHYNNINVVNMSWGGSSFDQACDDMLKEIYEKGIILVGAAGNANNGFTINIDYPAISDYVMAVSASAPEDEVAYFSQTRKWMGTGIEVAAPGTYIISDRYMNSSNAYGRNYSSPGSDGDGCFYWPTDCSMIFGGGNSMSSAMVSGVTGLIYSVGGFTSKTIQTSNRVRKIIKFTSDDIGNDNLALNGAVDSNAGYGRINAERALTFLEDGRIGIKSIVVLYKNPSDMNTLDQNCSDGVCYVVSNAETGAYQFPANIPNGAYKITSCIADYENPNIDSIFSSLGFSNHNFFCIIPQDVTISGSTQRNIDFNIDNL